ncbi:Sodium/myo-inositol cotransporter-like protein [Dinothrombium tinctorium]|uniref:Sodium/myo-inositol cotransporter-like protein n=1 Tax=Dinothrombium tinctorium TaxID=1965070 RepID=A0A443R0L8_9ACAR|nr:Sodium/myo-inositol cotransporter-like protein [Dinothrombium tinctorium]RWS09322.1 Sodium/myo-inositol cotransporter-like protein [Dinothrombium tinctorium]
MYSSITGLLMLTAICTVTGGLAAVMYTETVQCFIMVIGAVIVAAKAFWKVGGWEALETKYMISRPPENEIPEKFINCSHPSPYAFKMLRPYDDPDLPWLGFLLGQTFASLWYWAADQVVVQRLLAAKSLAHAQGGTLFAGFLKTLPLFLIIVPGMISRVLYPSEIACVDPEKCYAHCENHASCSNAAYPTLVMELMPDGLRGLMMAGMLAALMSGLASIFNSASTMFTIDIWPQIRKKASLRELMIVGRAFVVVMVLISILWIPVIEEMQGGQIFIYIQAISAYLAPPIATVFVLAVMWTRMNEPGAFWSLVIGLLAGVIRMILDVIYKQPPCGEDDLRPFLIRKIHYMYFAIVLVCLSSLTAVIVSLLTEPTEKFRVIKFIVNLSNKYVKRLIKYAAICPINFMSAL